jgi:hypothetical protein
VITTLELDDPDDRGRVLEHARIGAQHVLRHLQREGNVGVVRHPDLDPVLTDPAVVVQDLADDLAVRDHHAREVRVPERGVEQLDIQHLALLFRYRDVVADPERAREDDRQPGHQVAEHALHGERDPRPGDAESRDQRQELHAEVLQRHDHEETQHEDVRDALDQGAYRRLETELGERPPERAARPAPGKEARRQDQHRDQQLRPEPYPHVYRGAGDLVHQLQLLFHRSSFPASLRMSNLAWSAI